MRPPLTLPKQLEAVLARIVDQPRDAARREAEEELAVLIRRAWTLHRDDRDVKRAQAGKDE